MDMPGPRISDVTPADVPAHGTVGTGSMDHLSSSSGGSGLRLGHGVFGVSMSNEGLSLSSTNAADHSNGDSAVQSTDTDALDCRISAGLLGYFSDPFAPLLSRRHSVQHHHQIHNGGNQPQPPLFGHRAGGGGGGGATHRGSNHLLGVSPRPTTMSSGATSPIFPPSSPRSKSPVHDRLSVSPDANSFLNASHSASSTSPLTTSLTGGSHHQGACCGSHHGSNNALNSNNGCGGNSGNGCNCIGTHGTSFGAGNSGAASPHGGTRLQPVINRGTYCRTRFIDDVCARFLHDAQAIVQNTGGSPQILSLGAGSDTRYFNLVSSGNDKGVKYFEVDFPETTSHKIRAVIQKKELRALVVSQENTMNVDDNGSGTNVKKGYQLTKGGTGLITERYSVVPGDLRMMDSVFRDLQEAGFKLDAPTLIICECLFLYLDPKDTIQILQNISNRLTSCCAVVSYDPVNPDTPFGKTMVHNLLNRGIEIPGIAGFPTVESHKEKFLKNGFSEAYSYTMTKYWSMVNDQERTRINKIEMLDEVEEWNLLLSSYCISYGVLRKSTKSEITSTFMKGPIEELLSKA